MICHKLLASRLTCSATVVLLVCSAASAQTIQTGPLDFLKSKDSSFALFANTSSTWSTSGVQYPNELLLLNGLPSNPTISARIDLLGPVNICSGCGGLRNVVISPDGDTALVSSDPSDTQPPDIRTLSTLFLLRNLKAFASTKNPVDLRVQRFSAADFPQLDNVSGLAFGPDGRWAVVNTGGSGYLDLTYAALRGAVVVITGLPDNPVFSAPFLVPTHSLGNIDLSLDGGTLLLNDTDDYSGAGDQKADQIVVRGVRPGSQPRIVSTATISKPAAYPDGPPAVRDARLTLDGRFVIAPIPLIRDFDPQTNLPLPANQIAILGPVRNGVLDMARLLTENDGVSGGPYHPGVSPDGDAVLVVNALDAGGANLLTGLDSGDLTKIKVTQLPFPFFGPAFPLGPNGPPVLAPHGQVIYTADGDTALVVNSVTPPLANLPLSPSLSVLTGFLNGKIRVAATLADPTFNPFDNRQQIATPPPGLTDYIKLYFPAGSKRDQMAFLVNDATDSASKGFVSSAVEDLENFIQSANGYVDGGVLSSHQSSVLNTLAAAGIQALIGSTENSSAAAFNSGHVSPDSVATLWGMGFNTLEASAGSGPLPTKLAGLSVTLIDNSGKERAAPLYLVSPNQISYVVPPGAATGRAIALVRGGATPQFPTDTHVMAAAYVDVEAVSPALFTVPGGIEAAAYVQRVSANGTQSVEPSAGTIDLGPTTDQVFLILFGTGIRGRSELSAVTAAAGGQPLTVSFAGAQPDTPGLDQVNLLLPRTLIGSGQVEIALRVDGWVANRVTINIR